MLLDPASELPPNVGDLSGGVFALAPLEASQLHGDPAEYPEGLEVFAQFPQEMCLVFAKGRLMCLKRHVENERVHAVAQGDTVVSGKAVGGLERPDGQVEKTYHHAGLFFWGIPGHVGGRDRPGFRSFLPARPVHSFLFVRTGLDLFRRRGNGPVVSPPTPFRAGRSEYTLQRAGLVNTLWRATPQPEGCTLSFPRSRCPHKAKAGTRFGRGLRAGETTTRNPLLLFVFVGLFLLRLAERQFCGSLFHEPPRKTRGAPLARPFALAREILL